MGSNKSRTFYTQAILPGASVPIPMTSTGQTGSDKAKSAPNNQPPPKSMVRTDFREQKLEKFLVNKPASANVNVSDMETLHSTVGNDANFEKALVSTEASGTKLKNNDTIEPMDTSTGTRSMFYKTFALSLRKFQSFMSVNILYTY